MGKGKTLLYVLLLTKKFLPKGLLECNFGIIWASKLEVRVLDYKMARSNLSQGLRTLVNFALDRSASSQNRAQQGFPADILLDSESDCSIDFSFGKIYSRK